MTTPVNLSEIIDAMSLHSDEGSSYFNKEIGELVFITDEELRAAEEGHSLENYPEWQRELIETAQDFINDDTKYIPLPSRFDIDEYNIMEQFCLSLEDLRIFEDLYSAIKGPGAFRRFKDRIYRLGVEEDWFKYREEAFKEIAIDWCERKGIEYIDDVKGREKASGRNS